jgi:hypothetical protein
MGRHLMRQRTLFTGKYFPASLLHSSISVP